MTATGFLETFYSVLSAQQRCPTKPSSNAWTKWMFRRIEEAAGQLACYTIAKHNKHRPDGGEYLSIDVTVFENSVWESWKKQDLVPKGYDPFVVPAAIIEHENGSDTDYIAYCAWKLCCHRSPIRVLICYERDKHVARLMQKLLSTVRRGKLMDGNVGELLVVVGREKTPDDISWEDYFRAFRWSGRDFDPVGTTELKPPSTTAD